MLRAKPDFVICRHSGSMAVLTARMGIPVLPIFYSNDGLGYEGLLTIGRAILRVLPRKRFCEDVAAHSRFPYQPWWLAADQSVRRSAPIRPDGRRMSPFESTGRSGSASSAARPAPIEQVRYACSLGALASVIAIPGAVPITHCGPGCATKQFHALSGINAYQGGEFHVPSTNIGNREVIFGGADRLDELIAATLKVMEAELFVVQTGCIPGLVGDDVASVVSKYRGAACRSCSPRPAAIAATTSPDTKPIIRAIVDQYRRRL